MPSGFLPLVSGIRAASRDLVRELGFMNRTLAGTGLPPSAVHAIIEIGTAVNCTAKDLSAKLLLEKSTVSRLVKSLVIKNMIQETRSQIDGRAKLLSLTHKGAMVFSAISQYAELRVSGALALLPEPTRESVLAGLEAYTAALTASRVSEDAPPPCAPVTIEDGYKPGLIGRIVEMHAAFYGRLGGFDVEAFEAIVAGGLAEFMPRVDKPTNQVWIAHQDSKIVGAIIIDGEELGDGPSATKAHLRWFVMDDQVRGTGVGKALLRTALKFCDERGVTETHLWTFKGLDAARHLYETHGFTMTDEYPGDQWGTQLIEQVFVRKNVGD